MSPSNPLVSVVTLSFNQSAYLHRAITSVLEQDYSEIEYLVVDPGSTDASRDIIDGYRDRLARVVLQEDSGPADGLNKAFDLARGEIFAYVNADDALLPRSVRRAVEAFAQYPNAAAIYGHGFIVDGDGRPLRRFRSTPFDARRFVFGGVNIMQQATFVRAEAFRAVGGFNVDNGTSWDAELLIDLALAGFELKRIHELLGIFALYESSISGSGRLRDEYQQDNFRIFERVVGRRPNRRDRLEFMSARIGKWVRDPAYLWWRFWDVTQRPSLEREFT